MEISELILINEFNENLTKLSNRSDIDTAEKLTSELYRLFPRIVWKAKLNTELIMKK